MQILGRVDLAAAVLVEHVEACAQLIIFQSAALALTHELTELVEIELAILVGIGGVTICSILPHRALKLLFTRGHVVCHLLTLRLGWSLRHSLD